MTAVPQVLSPKAIDFVSHKTILFEGGKGEQAVNQPNSFGLLVSPQEISPQHENSPPNLPLAEKEIEPEPEEPSEESPETIQQIDLNAIEEHLPKLVSFNGGSIENNVLPLPKTEEAVKSREAVLTPYTTPSKTASDTQTVLTLGLKISLDINASTSPSGSDTDQLIVAKSMQAAEIGDKATTKIPIRHVIPPAKHHPNVATSIDKPIPTGDIVKKVSKQQLSTQPLSTTRYEQPTPAIQPQVTSKQASINKTSTALASQLSPSNDVKNDVPDQEGVLRSTTTAATPTTNLRPPPTPQVVDINFKVKEPASDSIELMPSLDLPSRLSSAAQSSQSVNSPMTHHAPSYDSRAIAHQMATQFSKQSDGTTVIRLNPDELGHIRMTLRNTDGVMTMTIMAERPETADIMRRNIQDLAQEFHSLGFDNLSFQFSGGSNSTSDEPNLPDPPPPVMPDDLDQNNSTETTQDAVSNGSLDMRL